MDLASASVFERTVSGLVRSSHLMPPDSITDAVAERTRQLGVLRVVIYLADLQQGVLRPLPSSTGPDAVPLSIDATVAGRAYRQVEVRTSEADEGRPRLWLPLLDGCARLGVMELVVERADEATLDRFRVLASVVGLLMVSKSEYSDTFARVKRSQPMQLQAELAWAFLPPRSFATPEVLLNVALEPAYEVGGDAFDYAIMGDRLNFSMFDASGHDLTAGMIAITALATCRNARRAGADLAQVADRADLVIGSQFRPGRFATALLCDLDVRTGTFTWLPCGHPPPLLVRGSKVVELSARPRPPLGVPPLEPGESVQYLRQYRLEPRDRLLLYTDGVVEAHDAGGQEFGRQRLIDFVNQYGGEGIPAPEALRRLSRAVVEHENGRLSDDATIMQLQWQPDRPEDLIF